MFTIVLDFETYYDNEYSLRKMTPVEYILDPRFEVIGCAVKEGEAKAFWLTEPELRSYLAKLSDKVTIVSHNALFDMCILSWHFKYVPHIMIDTLGMARAWLGHKLKSLALNAVAAYLGLGVKGDTVHKVVGMGLEAIKAAGFYADYAEYSCNDADLCWGVYRELIKQGYPAKEIPVMDTVIRCAVEPAFMIDQWKLAEHLNDIRAMKQNLLARCGLSSRDDLMSNDKFAEALRSLGVEPPVKISLTTGKETYAFSKTDPDFLELEDHEDPAVGALVSARLGVKSTLEETRTERLMKIGELTWEGNIKGRLPMPLRYSGAHTHRLSGDWKLNMQNLPSRGNNKIRSAIVAPPGHQVVTCDASQIEARFVAWFCGEHDLVDAFAQGKDVYSLFASEVFGRTVTKADKAERFVGKTAILGLGYGLGWLKFQKAIKLQSKAQTGQEILLTDEEALNVVKAYRNLYPKIPKMWRTLGDLIPHMTSKNFHKDIHPITFGFESIRLPSGLYLNYHDLEQKGDQWWFSYGGKPKYLYGGKMLENIIQALARIVVMDAAVRIRKRFTAQQLPVQLNLQVHDELVYIVPDHLVATVKAVVLEEMSDCPEWASGLPLAAEAGSGPSYGDAK